jgi:hypothetical protein
MENITLQIYAMLIPHLIPLQRLLRSVCSIRQVIRPDNVVVIPIGNIGRGIRLSVSA